MKTQKMMRKHEITEDTFLGGKLVIEQPREGYRAGNDSVLLASSLFLRPYQTLLDLGCGVGTAFLCALARERSLKVTAVELQKKLSDLAIRNVQKNSFCADIMNLNVDKVSSVIGNRNFDHVIFNPPFFDYNAGTVSKNKNKSLSNFSSEKELENWVRIGMKRLKPNGTISVISRIESLTLVLKTLEEKVGSIKILPVSSFEDMSCSRVIIGGKLGSKGKLSLLPPLVMHSKSKDAEGKASFSKLARGILYDGNSIELFSS